MIFAFGVDKLKTDGHTGGKKVMIRKAEEKDIPRMMELLGQVLQIHADIRPDIFIPGTTKYSTDELRELLKNEKTY